MQSKEKNDIIFIRFNPNEDLNAILKQVCNKYKIKTAIIISGIGQLKNVKLGYFKGKNDYSPKEFDKPMEILSLTGNICKEDDEYLFHLHTVLGDENKNAIGGHFIEGTIGVTAEIILLKTNIDIKRQIDKETGLKTLFLE